jgi:hypothetical protein
MAPPHGEMDPQSPLRGRLRLPVEWSVYFGSQNAKLAAVHPCNQEQALRAFLAGHEFRIVSLAQLLS